MISALAAAGPSPEPQRPTGATTAAAPGFERVLTPAVASAATAGAAAVPATPATGPQAATASHASTDAGAAEREPKDDPLAPTDPALIPGLQPFAAIVAIGAPPPAAPSDVGSNARGGPVPLPRNGRASAGPGALGMQAAAPSAGATIDAPVMAALQAALEQMRVAEGAALPPGRGDSASSLLVGTGRRPDAASIDVPVTGASAAALEPVRAAGGATMPTGTIDAASPAVGTAGLPGASIVASAGRAAMPIGPHGTVASAAALGSVQADGASVAGTIVAASPPTARIDGPIGANAASAASPSSLPPWVATIAQPVAASPAAPSPIGPASLPGAMPPAGFDHAMPLPGRGVAPVPTVAGSGRVAPNVAAPVDRQGGAKPVIATPAATTPAPGATGDRTQTGVVVTAIVPEGMIVRAAATVGAGSAAQPSHAAEPASIEADLTGIAAADVPGVPVPVARRADVAPDRIADRSTNGAPEANQTAVGARERGRAGRAGAIVHTERSVSAATLVETAPAAATLPAAPPAPAPAAADAAMAGAQLAAGGVDRALDVARQSAWIDGLAQDVARAAAPGADARFTLAPAGLGRIEVTIARTGGGADIVLAAADPEARLRLDAGQDRLAHEARAHGLELRSLRIESPIATELRSTSAPPDSLTTGAYGGGVGGQSGGQTPRDAQPRPQPPSPRAARGPAAPPRERTAGGRYA